MNKHSQSGFSLVEVLVCLAIVAFAVTGSLASIGGASEDVMQTVSQRKMRYLMQNILSDVVKGKMIPDAPEEEEQGYEEGMSGTFEDFASDFNPNEYDNFEWSIRVFRDEVIVGAPDEETLLEQGFVTDENGNVQGRPVSSDPVDQPAEGEGFNPQEPPGQLKRVLVFTVIQRGETSDDDREFTVMTYLPFPGEEEQSMGGEGEGGPGGPETPGATGAAGEPGSGARTSNTSDTQSRGSDR